MLIGRNDKCWCGSGEKYKKCHMSFDEKLNYIGQYDAACPMTVLIKAIDDKIAELRNKTVVDIGQEFKFLTEPPYGYYNNYICMLVK